MHTIGAPGRSSKTPRAIPGRARGTGRHLRTAGLRYENGGAGVMSTATFAGSADILAETDEELTELIAALYRLRASE